MPSSANLSKNQLAKKTKEYRTLSKAYLAASMLLFGVGGLHWFYLRKHQRGFSYLVTLGGVGIGQVRDIFRMRQLVRQCNMNLDIEFRAAEFESEYMKLEQSISRVANTVDCGASTDQSLSSDSESEIPLYMELAKEAMNNLDISNNGE